MGHSYPSHLHQSQPEPTKSRQNHSVPHHLSLSNTVASRHPLCSTVASPLQHSGIPSGALALLSTANDHTFAPHSRVLSAGSLLGLLQLLNLLLLLDELLLQELDRLRVC